MKLDDLFVRVAAILTGAKATATPVTKRLYKLFVKFMIVL